MLRSICVILYLWSFVTIVQSQNTAVSTPLGEIVGTIQTTAFNKNSYTIKQFLGIPYGKPPVGNLRFRKPQPYGQLNSPFNASAYGYICPQLVSPDEPLVGIQDEDCLHLNIFVPTEIADSQSGHAVMIWIHGGAFILGSSDEYDSKILAGYGNVIVVTINYRLGPLGFLSTMDSSCPGNFGLWDQRLAIHWVRNNIASFGGDIERITIFGESAGAISSTMHGMFPDNAGLFQRMIVQSGSPSVRSMNCSRDTLAETKFYASQFGCDRENTEELVDCLRQISWQDYMRTINDLNEGFTNIDYVIFDPVVDRDYVKYEPRQVYEMVKTRSLDEIEALRSFDMMSGMNAYEGAYYVMFYSGVEDQDQFKPTREEMRRQLLPTAMKLVYGREFPDVIMNLVEHEYTNWTNPMDHHEIRMQFQRIFGDTGFAVPTVEYARLQLTSPPTSNSYVYKFMPRPTTTSPVTPSWIPGANHADDLGFVFGFHNNPNAQEWEIELAGYMMRYWTNFAKSGNPNKPIQNGPEWKQYDLDNQYYMALDKGMPNDWLKQYVYAEEYSFWLDVFPQVVKHADDSQEHQKWCENVTSGGSQLIPQLLLFLMSMFSCSLFNL
ncbi:Carboxylesterase 5A [Mactra antiquata]